MQHIAAPDYCSNCNTTYNMSKLLECSQNFQPNTVEITIDANPPISTPYKILIIF